MQAKTTSSSLLKQNKENSLFIYGTRTSDIELAEQIQQDSSIKYTLSGFISPESNFPQEEIKGLPVYPETFFFTDKNCFEKAKAIVIQPDSWDRDDKQLLARKCFQCQLKILVASSIKHGVGGESTKLLRKANIADILQRIPMNVDWTLIKGNLQGKTILITGAAGSIGSEIVRQLSDMDVKSLVLLDVAETPLYEIGLEIEENYPQLAFSTVIGSVKEYPSMRHLFDVYKPEIVFHAAAYKHVPLMEEQAIEAFTNNVVGTKNLADLASEFGVEAFVMISTDKAVNPSNVMGMSKRVGEIYIHSFFTQLKKEQRGVTRFITTRFGNVLGSNGSVIPRFKQQIKNGGPVTVTHPDIIRYFMTIPEACRLVLEAGSVGKGGEIFIFDMGDSVKIKDMAEEMIRLSGLEPYKDIDIVFTGLRPGEKLYEELFYNKETIQPTHNPQIMIGSMEEYDYNKVVEALNEIQIAANNFDDKRVVELLKQFVVV